MPYPVEFFESTQDNLPSFRNETGSIKDSLLSTNEDGDLVIPGHLFVGSSGVSVRYSYISGNTGLSQGEEVYFPHNILDIGNVYGSNDIDLSVMRHSAGVGIRWSTAIAPLQLGYGWVLDAKEDESPGRFEFSLGSMF